MAKGRKTGGRVKGQPNKVTTDFKLAVTRLLQKADLTKLLDAVPDDRKLDVLCRLAEYAFPKLGRTEVTGENGGPLTVEVVKYAPNQDPEQV